MDNIQLPVEDVIIERDVKQETPDGVKLSTYVSRPAESDDEPVPAILNRTIYGIADDVVARGFYLDDAFASKALANGFAIVYQHSRGRGKSEGEYDWPTYEKADGASAIEWLAKQSWCNGDVGMWGGSNRGTTQMLATAANPEPLKAINPIAVPNRRLKHGVLEAHSMVPVAMQNVLLSAVRLQQQGVIDDETLAELQEVVTDASERAKELASHRPLIDLPNHIFEGVDLPEGIEPNDLIPFWENQLANYERAEYWADIDLAGMYKDMDVPALHVTGWFDSCQNGTMSAYRGMCESTEHDQFLLCGPYHHMNIGQSSCIGDVDFGPRAGLTGATFSGFAATQVEFFNVYLKGDEPQEGSLFDSSTPSVQTFRMHNKGGEWVGSDAWTPSEAMERSFHLGSDGDAAGDIEAGVLSDAPVGDADTFVHDPLHPVPSRGGPLSARWVDHQPGVHDVSDIQRRHDILTYTSPPLDAPLEIVGSPHVDLHAATSAADTDFVVRLSHVLEDGRALNFAEGGQRVAFQGDGYELAPVTPGEPFQVQVQCWDTHYRIPSGGRLRLEVMSSSFPRFDPHPGTLDPFSAGEDDVHSAEQTVFHDDARPSNVTVHAISP